MAYLLEFLRNQFSGRETQSGEVEVDYRLTCSGAIYNGSVLSTDWTKSFVSRTLSTERFKLIASYDRQSPYPQEICLEFKCPYVTVHHLIGNVPAQTSFLPDEEIASDLAAVLTLFSRRLITVAGKVREIHNHSDPSPLSYPIPIQGKIGDAWPVKPSTVTTWPDRVELHELMPTDSPLNQKALARYITWIAEQPDDLAVRYVLALRLYQQALRLIHEEVGVAYQLLISAIETISGVTVSGPSLDEILGRREELVAYLKKLGVEDKEVRNVIQLSTKDASWSTDRFIKFLMSNVQNAAWLHPDPLYPGQPYLEDFMPVQNELGKMLRNVYRNRSASSHSGKPFPDYVSIGLSPFMSHYAISELGENWPRKGTPKSKDYIPPIIWFERITQSALYGLTLAEKAATNSL